MKLTIFVFLLLPIVAGLIAVFLVWFRTGGSGLIIAADCGVKDDLHPCNCKQKEMVNFVPMSTLSCTGLDNPRDLLRPLEIVRRGHSQVNDFRLENSTFRFLPSEVFKGLKFKRITINSCALSSLTDSDLAFVGLEHELQSLKLEGIPQLRKWNWSIFRHLSTLKGLDVIGCDVNTLDKPPEDSMLSLIRIAFVKSRVALLHAEVLQDFRDLWSVSFNGNLIQEVKRTMLPTPALKLARLDFSYNEIKDFPVNMFTEMPALGWLNIESNKILTLNEKTFKPLTLSLVQINARGNDLVCDCRLYWILTGEFHVTAFCRDPLEKYRRNLAIMSPEELRC